MKYSQDYKGFVVSNKIEVASKGAIKEMEVPPEVSRGLHKAGGIRSLEKMIPKPERIMATARYHGALSDKIRLRILYALAVTDMCPCILKAVSGTSDSKLSYHLKLLQSEGLITARRVKNWRVYSISVKGRRSLGL